MEITQSLNKKRVVQIVVYDLFGSLLLGISVVVFAVHANFAPGGITGLAVITNYILQIPIGLATILINIPVILFTFKKLGSRFFLISAKTMLIYAFIVDYVVCYLPAYEGNRLIASVLSGIFAGIGYSLIFNEGSSTGGTDFIIVAVKQRNPNMSFGLLAFEIDSIVVLLSVFVFKEAWTFIYGMVYSAVTSIALDATTKLLGYFGCPAKADQRSVKSWE